MIQIKVSLIVPIRDEEHSILNLEESIKKQTFQPDEILFVDGGSTDKTIYLVEQLALKNPKIKLIKTPNATPGKGRNAGIEQARNEWIALTDAGIKLSESWLEELILCIKENPFVDIVYGNYSPSIENLFEKCATFGYVPPHRKNGVRGKFIASSLLRKTVWKEAGGFPDLRAAEDLIFMEKVEEKGFRAGYAPKAVVYWHLRPDVSSTFIKFASYSKYNVWEGRQWDWHHRVLRQYVFLFPFIVLAFWNIWWLSVVFAWIFARTAKRILVHREQFGFSPLFNPLIFFGVMFLMMTIDTATFVGWGKAILHTNPRHKMLQDL